MKELSYEDSDNITVGEDKDFIENKSIFLILNLNQV